MDVIQPTMKDFLKRISDNENELISPAFTLYFERNSKFLAYRLPTDDELKDILKTVADTVEADARVTDVVKKQELWQKGWSENLKEYDESEDLTKVAPKYYRRSPFLRQDGSYIIPKYPDIYEYTYMHLFRQWMFDKFFHSRTAVYEFGCGSGDNLVHFCANSSTDAYGLDYTQASVDLVNLLAKRNEFNLKGILFDMTKPDYTLNVKSGSALFTMGALEQIPEGYENFVEFVINKKFDFCMHVEPMYELYDNANVADTLSIKFHDKRRYIKGYLPLLKKLEAEGRIEIYKIHRPHFGNMMQDSWSYVAWRPL